jgi:two-component system, sensor histidine kinase PdtaS
MKLTPQSKYTDYYDIAKFNLAWNINLFLFFVLSALSLVFFVLVNGAAVPTLMGSIVTFIMLIIIYKTKSYVFASYVFTIVSIILSQYTLLCFDELIHFVDVLWILMGVLFTYFTLGKIVGHIVSVINIIGVSYYIIFVMAENIKNIHEIKPIDTISLTINYIVVSLIIIYFLVQFIHTTKYAENKYKKLTLDLQNKNLQVERQNEEKTVLLREIHHRVKNNLQVITSLLRLQSNEIKDTKTNEIYSNTINRVVAMALIHEKMYQNKDLAKINLKEYLHSLIDEISKTYSVEKEISITIETNVDFIKPKNLVPFALICNELLSNSYKYAFESVIQGEIVVEISLKNEMVSFEYKDNGIWLENRNENSFGLELIETLVEQLDGTFERTIENGTKYHFQFPDNGSNEDFE